jgi:hypothetical protein
LVLLGWPTVVVEHQTTRYGGRRPWWWFAGNKKEKEWFLFAWSEHALPATSSRDEYEDVRRTDMGISVVVSGRRCSYMVKDMGVGRRGYRKPAKGCWFVIFKPAKGGDEFLGDGCRSNRQ